MDGGAWWAAVHGVAKSWTRLSDFTFTFMHWRRKWQPTPVFLPRGSQGRGSLVGCRLCGRTESDTTEATWQQQQLYHSLPLVYLMALSLLISIPQQDSCLESLREGVVSSTVFLQHHNGLFRRYHSINTCRLVTD